MLETIPTLDNRPDVAHVLDAYEKVCKFRQRLKKEADATPDATMERLAARMRYEVVETRRLALRERIKFVFDEEPELPPEVALEIAILLPLDAELEALGELREVLSEC